MALALVSDSFPDDDDDRQGMTPATDTSAAETPGAGTPGAGTPGTGTPGADTPAAGVSAAGLVERAVACQEAVVAAEVELAQMLVEWARAAQVPHGELDDPLYQGDRYVSGVFPAGGEGTPWVDEYRVAEFAVALGWTVRRMHSELAAAVEAAVRLPRLWERLLAGKVRLWQVRGVAHATMDLPVEGAAFVDRHLEALPPHTSFGPTRLARVVMAAWMECAPAKAAELTAREREQRRVSVDLASDASTGTARVFAQLDLLDGRALEEAVRAGAAALAELGRRIRWRCVGRKLWVN